MHRGCLIATWGPSRHLNVTRIRLNVLCFQGVWSMEGQQPGSGETGWRRGQWGPVPAPRSRLPAHHPPAGEAADTAGHHGEPDPEIRHSPPPVRHSGRYSRARLGFKARFHTLSNVFWGFSHVRPLLQHLLFWRGGGISHLFLAK